MPQPRAGVRLMMPLPGESQHFFCFPEHEWDFSGALFIHKD